MLATYLARSVNDLSRKLLALVLDNFAERVLDGRVITLNEVPVNKLHR